MCRYLIVYQCSLARRTTLSSPKYGATTVARKSIRALAIQSCIARIQCKLYAVIGFLSAIFDTGI